MMHPSPASRRTWRHLALMLLGLGLLTGCQLLKPEKPLDDPVALTPAEMNMSPGSTRPRTGDGRMALRDGDGDGAMADSQGGAPGARPALPSRESRQFANRPATPSLARQMVKDPRQLQEQLDVKFNFDADDVPLVVEAFALLLDFRFVVDPAVSGSVNFKLDSKMSREEVWGLLEHILWISGAYLSPADGYVNVLPFAKMPQERRLMVSHRPEPNVDVRLVRAEAIPAANLASALQPFMTAGASATVVPHLNAILLVEAPANLPKLLELTRELDQLGETRWPQISVVCEHVDADTILEELKNIMPILGFPITTGVNAGSAGAGGVKLTALPRLQAIIASAPTQDVLAEVERWVRVLDQAESGEQERIFFYDVKYNNAVDISDAVSAFFTGTSTSRSRSSSGSDSDAQNMSDVASNSTTNRNTTANSVSGNSGSGGSLAASESVFETPVRVFVDGNHNRLVLRTTPRAYAVLEALLTRLDTPPLQVLIQVTIAEIQLSKSTEFGFKYAWQKALSEKYEILPYFDPNGTGTALVDGGNLLFRSIAQPEQIFGMIQAVAGKGNTRILFSPQIVAINDQEATINAGDEVPVVTQETNTGDSSNITRSIQFRNTGIILTVTPHITSEGMVRMELRQEVSDAVETTSSNIDSPTIRTRSLESTLLVDDGTTLLLGGLISSRDIDNDSGLPYLKDLPKVGHLFKQTSRSNSRQELVLLLTVRVLQRDTDLESMIKRYKRSVEAIRGSDSNPGKM